MADIVGQEMYRKPDGDLDLTEALSTGRSQLGPGRYETLLHVGERDGYPRLTFTAPWGSNDVDGVAPSAAYLVRLARGLAASHGWDTSRTATYLAGLPGARGTWTSIALTRFLTATA